jgi:hypothetical protein
MTALSPADRALVEEMRARPLGPYSPNLQRVLNQFRSAPAQDKEALVCLEPGRRWALARLGARGAPVAIDHNRVFTDLAEAEWYVFCERWRRHRGQALDQG